MQETDLSFYSVVLLWSSMAVYAIAFIAFAMDLARRSADVGSAVSAAHESSAPAEARVAAAATVGAAGATPARPTRPARGQRTKDTGPEVAPSTSPSLRVGVVLTVFGFLLHVGATVLRGIDAQRVPWANMYEFAMTGTLLIVLVFLAVLTRKDLRFLGTFVIGLVLVLLGASAVNFYVAVVPLPPALQSAWLIIHVFVAALGTGFFALGFALSALQLVQNKRESSQKPVAEQKFRFLATLPGSARLENLSYRVNIIGFILWTFTLIAGAIWAERAWGRYWGWDTKEVWTFIIWVLYAGYIHARATKGWRGSRSAWLAIVGFIAVIFNFTIVNMFFNGLHSYSGL
ncbi:MAG: c-type cytochrome biogenesis protein CcsB [Mycetocola sp.]